jgi:dihydropteroate synthase
MKTIKSMGVINITPNSFSDGNLYNSKKSFQDKFYNLSDWSDIIDIGAESTAPSNQEVSAYEEFRRFESTLTPYLNSHHPFKCLSIDTYKPEVFYEVYHLVKSFWPKTKVIFNDVSGVLDGDLFSLLNDKKLKFDYVLCHNRVRDRADVQNHMKRVSKDSNEELLVELITFFNHSLDRLSKTQRRVIIDPCFGFAKSRPQNHYLLKNINKLISSLNKSTPFLYGISRKSFLRFPKDMDAKDTRDQARLDQMQSILIHKIIQENFGREFIFRLHDEGSLISALNIDKILR